MAEEVADPVANGNVGAGESIQKDVMLAIYVELNNHARHVETIRTNVINFVLVIATASTAIITSDRNIVGNDLPLSILIGVIGIMAAVFSAVSAERYHRNKKRAHSLRKKLDEHFSRGALMSATKIIDGVDEEWWRSNRLANWLHHFLPVEVLWLIPPLAVLALGTILTILELSPH